MNHVAGTFLLVFAGLPPWRQSGLYRRCNDESLREQFLSLEPENGWGTFSGAIGTLRDLQELAERYPHFTWDIR